MQCEVKIVLTKNNRGASQMSWLTCSLLKMSAKEDCKGEENSRNCLYDAPRGGCPQNFKNNCLGQDLICDQGWPWTCSLPESWDSRNPPSCLAQNIAPAPFFQSKNTAYPVEILITRMVYIGILLIIMCILKHNGACNPSMWKADVGRSRLQGWLRLYNKMLCQKTKQNKTQTNKQTAATAKTSNSSTKVMG